MPSKMADFVRRVADLPDGWRSLRVGDVAQLGGGTTPSRNDRRYWDGATIPWATPSDITSLSPGVTSIASTESMVSERALVECSLSLNPPGTVLMTSRATIGFAALNTVPMATNQGFITFKAGQDLDPAFLLQWLIAQRNNLVAAAGGSTFKELSRGTAKLLPILLPPLVEQRSIVEVLCSVDEAIAANEAVAEQAQRAYQATLAELVGIGHDHWETVRLGQIATFVNGRGFKPYEWGEEGLPIIRIQNLNGGTNFNYYSGDFNPKILVRHGDLLFAWSGSRGTSFGPHIWRGPEGVLNYHTWNVLPNEREDRDFLYFALRHLTKKIEDEAHGASALVHMQKAYVVDYEISLPPADERRAIADTLIDLQEAAARAARVHREARMLKKHLMFDLFSGHVRVPAKIEAPVKAVPPAFKRAVFAAEIVHQLHNDNRFGAVKHEKIVHLCELHLDLHDELDRHAYKKAAGPYDPVARRSVEQFFQQQKWFAIAKLDGKRVVYTPLEKAGDHAVYFDRYFGEKRASIQSIIDLLRPLDTEKCEMIATAYAVWNDFIIDGHHPSDVEIVASILAWHPRKARISEDRWSAVLPWIRQQGLVPRGTGEKTRAVST